jgi:hypothetical protein
VDRASAVSVFPWSWQVVNLVTNRVAKVIGMVENTERFLRVALYQVRIKHGPMQMDQKPTNPSVCQAHLTVCIAARRPWLRMPQHACMRG